MSCASAASYLLRMVASVVLRMLEESQVGRHRCPDAMGL